MGHDTDYFWVVLCKNRRVHNRDNLFSCHCIPLGETDSVSPAPQVNGGLTVSCDECGKEYTYKAKDLMRAELECPESFIPHPLFREPASNVAASAGAMAAGTISTVHMTALGRIRTLISSFFTYLR